MRVVYIACEINLVNLLLPVASGIRKLFPDVENILIDPSDIFYNNPQDNKSIADFFIDSGFKSIRIDARDFPDFTDLNFTYKAYLFFSRLYKKIKPSIIVVPHELGYAFYAVQAAKIFGIPTYHVQHALWSPDRFLLTFRTNANKSNLPYQGHSLLNKIKLLMKDFFIPRQMLRTLKNSKNSFYKIAQKKKPIPHELKAFENKLKKPELSEYYYLNADKMAVTSPYYKQILMTIRPEISEDRLDVIGYLRGDYFFNNPVEPIKKIYERYDLDPTGPLAIYFYAPYTELMEGFFEFNVNPNEALIDVIKILKALNNKINILVLLHPLYRFGYYYNEISTLMEKNKFGRVKINKTHNDHFSLYKAASIILGLHSSSLYEAMLANVPIVLLSYQLSRICDPLLIEGGGVIPVLHPLHLKEQIKKALHDESFKSKLYENQKQLCENILGPFDGKCGERAANAIVELAARKIHDSN